MSETDALPEIWMGFEDFTAKYQGLQRAGKALSDAASGGNMEKMKHRLSVPLERVARGATKAI
ncbi:MAG: cytochrome c [Candidatus Sedimenticola sp. (ex Thyasira tokunagai)]